MINTKLYRDLREAAKDKMSCCEKTARPYLEKMVAALDDPSFCRVNIEGRIGEDFRNFQYKYECVFNTVMEDVLDAVSDAVSTEEISEICRRMMGWSDIARQIFGI